MTETAPDAAGDTLTVIGQGGGRFGGRVRVPGDKSISHRAVLFGALASGRTDITGWLPANDCRATVGLVRALGATVTVDGPHVVVEGHGPDGLHEPTGPLDCGGSGTTMRLAAGILAGLPIYTILDGNAQLRSRPMDRVAEPLRRMGATILGRAGGRLAPLAIEGGGLRAIEYQPPMASAQVKSAVLLAGLFATGMTVVREPAPTRDHTERLLRAMGAGVETPATGVVTIWPSELQGLAITVPGDISSAAFLLAAGAIVPDAALTLTGVGVNPTRTGVLDVLRAMGAPIAERDGRLLQGEPVADLQISAAPLRGTTIGGPLIPRLIDELPVLAVVATQAAGVTEVRDAAELRVKETDRIATVAAELARMGAQIRAAPRWLPRDRADPLARRRRRQPRRPPAGDGALRRGPRGRGPDHGRRHGLHRRQLSWLRRHPGDARRGDLGR